MHTNQARFTRWILLAALAVVTPPAALDAQEAREVANRVLPSVAMLVMHDANGETIGLGSGFLVKPGIVATNAHVIEDAAGGVAVFTGDETEHNIAGIVGFDFHHDIALLSVPDAQAPPLSIGDGAAVGVGDTVYAVGSPRGMAGTFSNGIISGLRDLDGAHIIQTTAPISPGSSGGPLVSDEGEVIGVTVAVIANAQNLNLAVAVRHLSDLTDNLHEPRPFSDRAQDADDADDASPRSVLDQLGGPAAKGIEFGSFVWEQGGTVDEARGSFTVRNNYTQNVVLRSYQVRFYDVDGELIETQRYGREGKSIGGLPRFAVPVISALGASRFTVNRAATVRWLNSPSSDELPRRPEGKIEFRVLDFELIDPEADPWWLDPATEPPDRESKKGLTDEELFTIPDDEHPPPPAGSKPFPESTKPFGLDEAYGDPPPPGSKPRPESRSK